MSLSLPPHLHGASSVRGWVGVHHLTTTTAQTGEFRVSERHMHAPSGKYSPRWLHPTLPCGGYHIHADVPGTPQHVVSNRNPSQAASVNPPQSVIKSAYFSAPAHLLVARDGRHPPLVIHREGCARETRRGARLAILRVRHGLCDQEQGVDDLDPRFRLFVGLGFSARTGDRRALTHSGSTRRRKQTLKQNAQTKTWTR